jgi:hypothetical protein
MKFVWCVIINLIPRDLPKRKPSPPRSEREVDESKLETRES